MNGYNKVTQTIYTSMSCQGGVTQVSSDNLNGNGDRIQVIYISMNGPSAITQVAYTTMVRVK